MFDFRYHAASLAAVFVALLVGLLLGVAIGDANLVSNAEKGLTNSLQSQRDAARTEVSTLQSELAMRTSFESAAYGPLLTDRLAGKRVGLLFLGSPTNQIDSLVRQALAPSGGQLVLVAAIGEPINLGSLASAVGSPSRYSALGTDPTLLRPFGVRIGLQLVRGGHLLQQLQSTLLSAFDGTLEPLDAVVLVRNDPTSPSAADAQTINTFESGLSAGLTAARVPVVGVETLTANPSNISWFQGQNFASVDDLDDIAGRVAMVLALSTDAHGAYGFKPTAGAILPDIPGVAPQTTP